MASGFSYTGTDAVLGGTTTPVAVFKIVEGSLFPLPNVNPWQISYSEGAEIPTARIGYVMDDRASNSGFPVQFEQLWPLAIVAANDVGPYVVLPGDELAIYCAQPDGSVDLMFHGFARLPQADVSGDVQHQVSISCVGAAIRAYDIPVQGRVQRNGGLNQVQTTDGSEDVPTNLPTWFNPEDARHPSGQPNCTPENFDSDPDGDGPGVGYPVFLDPNIDRPGDPDHSPRLWTLSGAVKYLLSVYNPPSSPPEDEDDPAATTYKQWVKNPDFTNLDSILDNRQPLEGQEFFDPNDSSTYTSNPVVVRSFDCTNMAWPDALSRLLGYHGFGMRWVLAIDENGLPLNTFEVYRKDAANPDAPKWVWLPPAGTPINPTTANVAGFSGAFDYHGVANSFLIETHPIRYEVSVILAPLFHVGDQDDVAANRKQFLRSNLDGATDEVRRSYRWYGVDELGDGYWDLDEGEWTTGKAFDFSDLWPAKQDPDTGEDIPGYVARYRIPIRDCLADDGNGDTYKAQLALSRNYKGDFPAFWDGSADWQPIEGDWKLLDDRLGIEFTADDPEAIHCGKSKFAAQTQNAGPILKGIKSIADPTPKDESGKPNPSSGLFLLRLTCVIEGDNTIEAAAGNRMASPLQNEIRRRIDAKEHFRRDVIHTSSAFYSQQTAAAPDTPTDSSDNLVVRDDTKAAEDFAAQMRTAHEFPTCPIAVTIPWLTLAYQVGNRVSLIAGRNASLQTNTSTEQEEAASFPFIVATSWSFSGDQQTTTLQLSDKRMEPQHIDQGRRR